MHCPRLFKMIISYYGDDSHRTKWVIADNRDKAISYIKLICPNCTIHDVEYQAGTVHFVAGFAAGC